VGGREGEKGKKVKDLIDGETIRLSLLREELTRRIMKMKGARY